MLCGTFFTNISPGRRAYYPLYFKLIQGGLFMPFSIRTDLAMEARELHPSLSGVTEETEEQEGVSITRIALTTDDAAARLEKRRGRYITLDAPELTVRPPDLFGRVSRALAGELNRLMEGIGPCGSVLVVGLGNRAVTPDSLGPRVV